MNWLRLLILDVKILPHPTGSRTDVLRGRKTLRAALSHGSLLPAVLGAIEG